jgi:hypothetical protein
MTVLPSDFADGCHIPELTKTNRPATQHEHRGSLHPTEGTFHWSGLAW